MCSCNRCSIDEGKTNLDTVVGRPGRCWQAQAGRQTGGGGRRRKRVRGWDSANPYTVTSHAEAFMNKDVSSFF